MGHLLPCSKQHAVPGIGHPCSKQPEHCPGSFAAGEMAHHLQSRTRLDDLDPQLSIVAACDSVYTPYGVPKAQAVTALRAGVTDPSAFQVDGCQLVASGNPTQRRGTRLRRRVSRSAQFLYAAKEFIVNQWNMPTFTARCRGSESPWFRRKCGPIGHAAMDAREAPGMPSNPAVTPQRAELKCGAVRVARSCSWAG